MAKNTYAIVVGISGYQDAAIPQLNFADKDAALFAEWLQTKSGGSVAQSHIKLLTNEKATLSAFYQALDWAKHIAKENDRVYIYFSGHGDVETTKNDSQGYLLAWNSPPNNYLNNAISVSDLNNTANELTTKNKAKIVLITDACHSGKMAGDFYKGKQLTAANLMLVLNNQVRMASCREDEEAAEGKEWGGGRGVFSYYLIKGLQGAAVTNDLVKLGGLQLFLDSSFAADKQLEQTKHVQYPVSDGSPLFALANVYPSTPTAGSTSTSTATLLSGLQSLKSVGPQPMDYFFSIVSKPAFESALNFNSYQSYSRDSVPKKMLEDYIKFFKKPLDAHFADSIKRDSTERKFISSYKRITGESDFSFQAKIQQLKNSYAYSKKYYSTIVWISPDTLKNLNILSNQLEENGYSRQRFSERFVQSIQDKTQEMINAYLKGDLAELEKRQYYSTGKRNYRDFLPLVKLAIMLAPDNDYLKGILKVNEAYLGALIDRLDITTHASKADSLLTVASKKINEAIVLEPYSAYIHNEMGNILFQKKLYDSALYHFNYATLLAPTWAIPYSNKIRVNLATNHLPAALAAAYIADSLQKDLSFVNTNAAIAMEKAGDLLGAQSRYLRAIKENKVHYLPYQNLGKLYIRTGEYAKADSFLYEANRRNEQFAVNESVFRFGIELGGYPDVTDGEYFVNVCNEKYDNLLNGHAKYKELLAGLSEINSAADSLKKIGKLKLEKIIEQQADVVLAAHYLGNAFYKDGNYNKAEFYLKRAIIAYRDKPTLKAYLKKSFTDSLQKRLGKTPLVNKKYLFQENDELTQKVDSSCLVQTFLYLDYNQTLDHYLLASLYEKNGDTSAVLGEYKAIIDLENKLQNDQAALVGFFKSNKKEDIFGVKFEKYLYDNELDRDRFEYKYNAPIFMGGTFKAAEILEKKGDYLQAEKVLLAQVAQNQAAGFARQRKINQEKFFSFKVDARTNAYWLEINEDQERETFQFYDRMVKIFPRDGYWYKNAGLFLYKRLWMTYKQVDPGERNTFYNYSENYFYPYRKSVDPIDEYISADKGGLGFEHKKVFLLGTFEEIKPDYTQYNPVRYAKYFLQQALKFSGDRFADPILTEYLADVQSWMGRNDSAIVNYNYALSRNPQNIELRNKLIDVLRIDDQLPELATNLNFLQKRGHLKTAQKLELAGYSMLQKKYSVSAALLQTTSTRDSLEIEKKLLLNIALNMLQGSYKKALTLANVGTGNTGLDDDTWRSVSYSKARLEAITNKKVMALKTLNNLFDNGFQLYYVLRNDEAWNNLRSTPDWRKMIQKYPFINIYEDAEGEGISRVNYDVEEKRIPALPK
ncbi:hypothetical protein [Pedobacter sp. UYEF25]